MDDITNMPIGEAISAFWPYVVGGVAAAVGARPAYRGVKAFLTNKSLLTFLGLVAIVMASIGTISVVGLPELGIVDSPESGGRIGLTAVALLNGLWATSHIRQRRKLSVFSDGSVGRVTKGEVSDVVKSLATAYVAKTKTSQVDKAIVEASRVLQKISS